MERGPFKFLLRAIVVVAAATGLMVFLFAAREPVGVRAVHHRDAVRLDTDSAVNVTGSAFRRDVTMELDTTTANATLEGHAVGRRAILEHATPEMFQLFEDCQRKGERLLDLMFTPEEEIGDRLPGGNNGQMYFDRKEYYKDWFETWQAANTQEVQEVAYLQGLRAALGFAVGAVPISFSGGNRDLKRFTWKQNKPYVANDIGYEPTEGHYDFGLSKNNKLIVINHASTPNTETGLPDDKLPSVHRFSDVLFMQTAQEFSFKHLPAGERASTPPRWIVIKDIAEPLEALQIVRWCLNLRLPGFNTFPRWQHRQAFPIGSQCHAALLGTAVSEYIAMFLLTHKFRFRDWVLASVTIFGEGKMGPNGEMPTLIWWVGRGSPMGNRFQEDVNLLREGSGPEQTGRPELDCAVKRQ